MSTPPDSISPLQIARNRLAGQVRMLVPALLAVCLLALTGAPAWLAVLLGAGLIATALLMPRPDGADGMPRFRSPAADETSDMARLSAAPLADAVPEPLLIVDRYGVVVHANTAARLAFPGLEEGIDIQLRFRSPEMLALVSAVLDGEAPHPVDYSERIPLERLFRVSASAIGADSGLFVIVLKDQSEARRIDRMRSDFIANASHELRTPLATISGFIETLRGPAKDDATARERFLGIMHSQTLRMARLIDDLLSLSRIEMKPFVASGEVVDLKLLVGSVIDSLNHMATEHGVVVERNFADEPILVPGSRDELFQVFENLIENACKYGQSGGRVEVSVGITHAPGPEAEIAVRDHGPGIAEEHIPRVTERFYRVDADGSRTHKGTGLGLAIVKHVLTRHGGRLSIRSRLGEGSTFTVNLPAG